MEIFSGPGGLLLLRRYPEAVGLGSDTCDPEHMGIAESVGTGSVFDDQAFQVFDPVICIHRGEKGEEKVSVVVDSHHAFGARARHESH